MLTRISYYSKGQIVYTYQSVPEPLQTFLVKRTTFLAAEQALTLTTMLNFTS